MAAFQFTAINSKGLKQKGIIEAESLKHARQLLRQKSLTPVNVQMAHSKNKISSDKLTITNKQSISNKELVLLTRQFATLLAAGIPVEEMLSAVAEQTEKPRTKGLILSLRSKVLEGHALASALRDFPYAFSNLYCATIAAGEKSGHLDIVLQRLADYIEQQYAMKQKIKNALVYPTLMVIVAVSIVAFLLEYIVPKMLDVYTNTGQPLPDMTKILIFISDGIKHYGLYFFILLVVCGFLFKRQMRRSESFKAKTHAVYLKIPIIGNSIKVANTARFARTFAILSSAGVPVLEAMSIASALITNIPIRNSIEHATTYVREGASIHLALKQTGYFPPMAVHLIASGESSGQLEAMLERAAKNQDDDIARLIETALALLEPFIILVMGSVVLFIVLAVLLPIFQLDQITG